MKYIKVVLSFVLLLAFFSSNVSAVSKPEFKAENTNSGVKLSWNGNGKNKSYTILRKTATGKKYKTIKALHHKCSFTDKTAKYGKKYFYKIKSGKTTFPVKRITRLKAPVITKIINSYKNGLYISWDSVKGASKYEVYSGDKRIATLKTNFISNYIPDSKNSIKYKVRAIKGKSESAFGRAVSWVYDENLPNDSTVSITSGAAPEGTRKIDYKEDKNFSGYDLSEYGIFGNNDAADTTIIFNSWNEYKSFFKKTFAEYDKEFFKTKSLIYLYRNEYNYSTKHEIGSLSCKNNNIYLTDVTLTRADNVVEPMIGNWNIFATVKKSNVKNIKQIVISKSYNTY